MLSAIIAHRHYSGVGRFRAVIVASQTRREPRSQPRSLAARELSGTRTQVGYAGIVDMTPLGSARPGASNTPRPKSARTPWGTITRQQIVESATDLVTTAGYERLTLRGLAAELGVAPMSLYRHIRDKDDVLTEVVDRLLIDAWQPRISKRDWQGWLGEAANRLRRFLVSQPAAMHVYLSHPVVSPAAVARMEAMLQVLRPVVDNEADAHRAYAAIHTYTVGFAALEASRARGVSTEEPSDSVAQRLAAFTTPRQFRDGLNYLLLGITNHGQQQ